MPRLTVRTMPDERVLEDGEIEKIKEGIAVLAAGGLDLGTINTVCDNIAVNHCESCNRYWLKQDLHYTPGWMPDVYGRGRRVDTSDIYAKLKEAGHEQTSGCESCTLKRAETFAAAILKLSNKNMRRFFKLYAHKIEQLTYNKGYHDTLPFRFHVATATILVRTLPAKQRKSFATLSEILAKMEIL